SSAPVLGALFGSSAKLTLPLVRMANVPPSVGKPASGPVAVPCGVPLGGSEVNAAPVTSPAFCATAAASAVGSDGAVVCGCAASIRTSAITASAEQRNDQVCRFSIANLRLVGLGTGPERWMALVTDAAYELSTLLFRWLVVLFVVASKQRTKCFRRYSC